MSSKSSGMVDAIGTVATALAQHAKDSGHPYPRINLSVKPARGRGNRAMVVEGSTNGKADCSHVNSVDLETTTKVTARLEFPEVY